MILLHTAWQCHSHNIAQTLNSQKESHSSSSWLSYGAPIESTPDNNNDCEISRVHCSITVYRALFRYKDCTSRYRDFHFKDKMVLWPSYLYNGNPYTDETASLYQIGPLEATLTVIKAIIHFYIAVCTIQWSNCSSFNGGIHSCDKIHNIISHCLRLPNHELVQKGYVIKLLAIEVNLFCINPMQWVSNMFVDCFFDSLVIHIFSVFLG